MNQLVDQHIAAQARLRDMLANVVASIWGRMPSYDETDVPLFLDTAVPVIAGAQRSSVALTSAFLARRLQRDLIPLDAEKIVGELRGGVPGSEVYRRPFVTVWSDLKAGKGWDEAVNAGLQRATSSAAMDVQLAMRQTLVEVGQRDHLILGYQRVPDAGACAFCQLVAGQRYTTDQLMPVHNRCGCGVDVITQDNRGDFTGKRANDVEISRDGVIAQIRDHGELGPLLVNGDHSFTAL